MVRGSRDAGRPHTQSRRVWGADALVWELSGPRRSLRIRGPQPGPRFPSVDRRCRPGVLLSGPSPSPPGETSDTVSFPSLALLGCSAHPFASATHDCSDGNRESGRLSRVSSAFARAHRARVAQHNAASACQLAPDGGEDGAIGDEADRRASSGRADAGFRNPARASFRNRLGLKNGFPVKSSEVYPQLRPSICAGTSAAGHSACRRCRRGDLGAFPLSWQRTGG